MISMQKTKQQKPRLHFWEIWNMSFGFLGIQFGFALQNANTSRIFQTLGAEVEDIPILWIAAPLTGLVVQPIVGYFSDRTWHPVLGRRRPYFLVGAVLASISLCLMPNSPSLWMAAGMLWIMDASINITMEPFRAFVGDNLPDEQRTTGFAAQSFFIGLGAVVASALPWMLTNWAGVDATAAAGEIPETVKWSFYVGAAIFLLAVSWTVFRSKEYTPEQLLSFSQDSQTAADSSLEVSAAEQQQQSARQQRVGLLTAAAGIGLLLVLSQTNLQKELYILGFGLLAAGVMWLASGAMTRQGRYDNGFVAIMTDLLRMPKTMRQLAVVQFFSWFALFAMWIYTTPAVTKHLYQTTDATSDAYNKGADWVGICFAAYSGVTLLFAFLLPVLAQRSSRKVAHMICLTLGGLGLISVYFIPDPQWLLLSMVGVGIAWASILAMPYAILTGVLPAEKMGYFMGVFNFFIVIPQIVAATILGFLVSYLFNGEAIFALIIGGISMIAAGIITLLFVDDQPA